MESKLTKEIKKRIHSYKPELNKEKRTVRYADEVSTPTGVVDSIKFEDYVQSDNSYCRKISPTEEDLKT